MDQHQRNRSASQLSDLWLFKEPLPEQWKIHRVIYAINAVESINAWTRKAIKARGHFPGV